MKKMSVLVASLCASAVFAGVAENKAKQAGDKEIEGRVAKYKEACGTDVKVESQHLDAAKIKVDGYTEANTVSVAGENCGQAVAALANLCSDADYKAEVAKIKVIKCTPKRFEKAPYWEVKLQGTTVSVNHDPVYQYYTEGIGLMKKLF